MSGGEQSPVSYSQQSSLGNCTASAAVNLQLNETPPPLPGPPRILLSRQSRDLTRLLLYSLDCLDTTTTTTTPHDNREASTLPVLDLNESAAPLVGLQHTLSSRSGDALLQAPMSNLSFGFGLSSGSRSFFVS